MSARLALTPQSAVPVVKRLKLRFALFNNLVFLSPALRGDQEIKTQMRGDLLRSC